MSDQIFFNAHHSPIGAFASMTFGCKGSLGGIASELKGPADQNLIIGLENLESLGTFQTLPFYDGVKQDSSAVDYDVEGLSDYQHPASVFHFPDSEISRVFGASTDTWKAGDLTFTIFTPVRPVPDPQTANHDDLKLAIVPAIIAELTIDNRKGKHPRKAFFGYSGSDPTKAMRIDRLEGLTVLAQGQSTGIATDHPNTYGGVAWQPEAVLLPRHPQNLNFNLGDNGLLVATVPAGETTTVRFAVGFYNQGQATSGIDTTYYYQSLFENLDDVLAYALNHADQLKANCQALDSELETRLGPVRTKTLGHAIRSYFGSTQLLRKSNGDPLWVVNEGEYRMMNTFDLTVDQLFLELALNPWTVRNVLDLFVERYSYEDQVRFPGEDTLHPGGLVFTHDMGVANRFSPEGFSCYEQAGLKGVFSYMSCEELVNWILCACLYVTHTDDQTWLAANVNTFRRALQSLLNRDNPNPDLRNGVMSLDSSRCQGGAEITTYDSLDASLGQARNNLYLAVKSWAAYVLMESHFHTLGDESSAQQANRQAQLCSDTVCASADENGLLPAVIGEGNEARLIPAIEGLVFPFLAGRPDLVSLDGPYSELRKTIERHFDQIMTPETCLFPDGGWKLSSTSKNSWLSKIYLCQFVSENIFGKPIDHKADQAHWAWLMDEDNQYFAWSDQMVAGKAHGSRYYPRGVTSILWLARQEDPLMSIGNYLKDPIRSIVNL